MPVIAGFMTGSGVLMIRSQVEPVAIPMLGTDTMTPSWIPAATALATMVAMWQGGRRLPAVPAVLPGLVAGIGVFYGLCWWSGVAAPAAWLVGELPRLVWSELDTRPAVQSQMPWLIIVVSAVVLAAFTSLDTLLTSVVADSRTGERHDVRREVVAQGLGHVAIGLSGGMAGAGTTAATMVAGAQRWAPLPRRVPGRVRSHLSDGSQRGHCASAGQRSRRSGHLRGRWG